MTIDFGKWMLGASSIVPSQWSLRAEIEWARILEMPSEVVFKRDGTTLEPQTVRIELSTGLTESSGSTGMSFVREAVVFGVRGHPDIDDLDIQVWDTFVMDDGEYTVTNVNKQIIGHVQAHAERVG